MVLIVSEGTFSQPPASQSLVAPLDSSSALQIEPVSSFGIAAVPPLAVPFSTYPPSSGLDGYSSTINPNDNTYTLVSGLGHAAIDATGIHSSRDVPLRTPSLGTAAVIPQFYSESTQTSLGSSGGQGSPTTSLHTSYSTSVEELAPRPPEEDPTVLASLLLNLRALYSNFLNTGHRWHTASETLSSSPGVDEACEALKSTWVRAALENVLCYYLQSSINAITSNGASPLTPFAAPVQGGQHHQPPSVDLLSPSLPLQTSPVNHNSKSLAQRSLVVLNLAAKENQNADMIRFQVRDWSGGRPDDPGLSLTMSYIPRGHDTKMGVSLTLHRPFRILQRAPLRPSLRTFNVIPTESPIIRCIQLDDMRGVRNLLDLKQATPSDIDGNGQSLLSVREVVPLVGFSANRLDPACCPLWSV
jgi:hypothetical protein